MVPEVQIGRAVRANPPLSCEHFLDLARADLTAHDGATSDGLDPPAAILFAPPTTGGGLANSIAKPSMRALAREGLSAAFTWPVRVDALPLCSFATCGEKLSVA